MTANTDTGEFRIEKDSMGEVRVPAGAYWGAQTQRALENFPISGVRFPQRFIRALGLVKMTAVRTNVALGLLSPDKGEPIATAAREVMDGELDEHFPLDIFQTGSGTSSNMNANEVIANRANQHLGKPLGDRGVVHPNDHVNLGQSSNDVIPTCMHIAAVEGLRHELSPALQALAQSLERKAREFADVLKIGRTHLQDATPVRLGQEFGGYARLVHKAVASVEHSESELAELALGGTAVGTEINTHPKFASKTIDAIAEHTGFRFCEAANHFESQSAKHAIVRTSSALREAAVSLTKIANDIRWLGCGPRCGIGEIIIPPVQPGSSIMPGKVNPVMAESLLQAAAQVMGNDTTIALGAMSGNFELNVMMPVMAHNLLQSIHILSSATSMFGRACVDGLSANRERCGELINRSLALVTALSPILGYDTAALIAKEAYEQRKTLREVVLEKKLMSPEELDRVLDPESMV